jgi:hypothetical protein
MLKIQYRLRNTYRDVKVETHHEGEITLTEEGVRALFEAVGQTHEAVEYPSLLKRYPTTGTEALDLSMKGFLDGTITKGRTAWTLTPLGAGVLAGLRADLDQVVVKHKQELQGLANSSLDYRLERHYYEKLPNGEEQLYLDLAKEFEVQDGPKVREAFRIARTHGENTGISDVPSYFSELIELLKLPDDPEMFKPKEEPKATTRARRGSSRTSASVARMRSGATG